MAGTAHDGIAALTTSATSDLSSSVSEMGRGMAIDIAFDFRTDAKGRDPDPHGQPHAPPVPPALVEQATTRRGRLRSVGDDSGVYLYDRSSLGEFFLSSDSVMPTFTRWPALKPIIDQFPEQENEDFRTIAYTIGAMMVFPGKRDRWQTDHQRRAWVQRENFRSVRPDARVHPPLLLERRKPTRRNPLWPTLSRYADFFALFGDFRGYVSFFLLEDLVTDEFRVKFFMPFDDFRPPSVPKDSAPTRSIAAARSNSSRPGTTGSNGSTPLRLG